ncbi:unnamed protein product [Vitrella brassicaformis CCMP3155]|uniref:FAD assembly factor SdhE n=1 Tax=Vitrella brassicaformis (strain CCMP3155) TaxID=1169540 RepID=A0A0G4E8C8_VITBC|nr:unnamed protein product [Vitrella brassicaformis CCMP3155]|eukprot:CEL91944.1 unnamed protein product [Vitrella brassicaformis CCMP3155]
MKTAMLQKAMVVPLRAFRPSSGMVFLRADLQRRCFVANTGEWEGRRKKLLYRSKQRGWLELDVLMGSFADKYLGSFSEQQLDQFDKLLDCENPNLFKWLSGQEEVPVEWANHDVYRLLAAYVRDEHPHIAKAREQGK